MSETAHQFLTFALKTQVLRFGQFTTKAGRLSPYFFNAGLFSQGSTFHQLCHFYADTIEEQAISFDFLFGPAYKGIPLVAGIALILAQRGRDVHFCYNRKEIKDHGEGGQLVGDIQGRALIIDDVISAGTSIRESVVLLQKANASASAVLTALDRMERGQGNESAKEEIQRTLDIPVYSIANVQQLLTLLDQDNIYHESVTQLRRYLTTYGKVL
jgi:orotate phosphoribosyltransferase